MNSSSGPYLAVRKTAKLRRVWRKTKKSGKFIVRREIIWADSFPVNRVRILPLQTAGKKVSLIYEVPKADTFNSSQFVFSLEWASCLCF